MKTFEDWWATLETREQHRLDKGYMVEAWNSSADNSVEEIAKRDERIESLTAAGAEYQRQCFGQSDRIKWLEQQVTRLKTVPMKYRRMEFNAQLQRENTEQAAEITRLKAVIAKCEAAINSHLNPCGCFNGCEFCSGKESLEEALAAIKEIDHA